MLQVYAGLIVCHKVMYVCVIYTIFLIEQSVPKSQHSITLECAKDSIFSHFRVCQEIGILTNWYAIKLVV